MNKDSVESPCTNKIKIIADLYVDKSRQSGKGITTREHPKR